MRFVKNYFICTNALIHINSKIEKEKATTGTSKLYL